jgi:hypothetical protein
MCCNIDSEFHFRISSSFRLYKWFEVFFSVLVLHWITSKDNASTMSSSSQNNEPTRTIQDPPSPKRLVPRPPLSELAAYELGLREWQRLTRVTTVVTAKEPDPEMEVDRISSMPPKGVIAVETAHVREVVSVRLDRTSIRTVIDEQQSGKSGRTDDLCRKNES